MRLWKWDEHSMDQPMTGLDVAKIRGDFPILSRTFAGHPLVYLDSAATSQKPQQVIDAVADFYANHNANAHRGIYSLGEEATERFEGARAAIARFMGAPAPETIVFTRGVTESINLVAQGWGRANLSEGDEVLITEMEHHSNIVPWQMITSQTGATLRYIPLTDDGLLDLSQLGSLLTARTKILSVTGMSNATQPTPWAPWSPSTRRSSRRTTPSTCRPSTVTSWRSADTRCLVRRRAGVSTARRRSSTRCLRSWEAAR